MFDFITEDNVVLYVVLAASIILAILLFIDWIVSAAISIDNVLNSVDYMDTESEKGEDDGKTK